MNNRIMYILLSNLDKTSVQQDYSL